MPGDSTSISHNRVWALHETSDGKLWIATEAGLDVLEDRPAGPGETSSSISISRFLDSAGIPVWSILEDEQGQLWIGQFNGRLIRLNPDSGQTRSFGHRHGLPFGSFRRGRLLSSTGILYWANLSGLVSLHPDRLPPPTEPPRLHLSELFNEPQTPGQDSPLEQALWQTETLQLNHKQNDLTIGYVGIHFTDPEENRYQYRLLGYDAGWRAKRRSGGLPTRIFRPVNTRSK